MVLYCVMYFILCYCWKYKLYYYYYHISRTWVNEIITTSAFSVDLENSSAEGTTTIQRVEREIMQHGCEDHAMGKARSSTLADAIRDEDEYDGYAR